MSPTTSSANASTSVDERRPLLESRTANSHDANVQLDPEAATPADEQAQVQAAARKVDYWRILWYLVLAILIGVVLAGMVKGFIENGDVEVCVVMVPTSS